mmetsp:Transcript_16089/g.40885  ORF Transcript_16089/g.40885 Transcript_16089/m.40885 type:complete len:451 (-) Transcript_16089:81-1433(-)
MPLPHPATRRQDRRALAVSDAALGGSAAAEGAKPGKQARGGGRDDSPVAPVEVPQEALQRNAELVSRMRGKLILAPLTRGGSLPYRRLCGDFGAEVTVGEMAFAKHLIKGDKVERSRMYRAANEKCFGVQMATKTIDEGVRAAKLAADAGADFIDLNCGCPIYEVTRRGLGAVLPQKPKKLARLVQGIAAQSPIPLTVKIRIGKDDKSVNVHNVVELLQESGAAAVTIHGRTMQARYRKPADWDLIGGIADSASIPIIGNGDILTHYEAASRGSAHNYAAMMVGRGALIKPWIFQEFKEGRELVLDAADRIGVYRQLISHMKDHFGNDAMGKRKAWYFLPWHFSFFCRYRPFPEELYGAKAAEYPLIGTRQDLVDEERGETLEGLPLLERLLRCVDEELHEQIAHSLWDSESDAEALQALERLAASDLERYELQVSQGGRDDRNDDRGQG